MATIITDDKHYKAIADTIRAISGYGFTYKPSEMLQGIDHVAVASHARGKSMGLEEGYAKGVEEGKQAQHNEFWDSYQDYGNRIGYSYAFAGIGWNDDTFKPSRNIIPQYSAANIFYTSAITDLESLLVRQSITLDLSNASRLDNAFAGCSGLTTVPEIAVGEGCTRITSMFADCTALKTIRKLTLPNKSLTVTGAFNNCSALENIEIGGTIAVGSFDFQYSTKLTKSSITSIINALSTTTSGLSITLSKTAVDNAFTSDEWAALIATKSNWTISLI